MCLGSHQGKLNCVMLLQRNAYHTMLRFRVEFISPMLYGFNLMAALPRSSWYCCAEMYSSKQLVCRLLGRAISSMRCSALWYCGDCSFQAGQQQCREHGRWCQGSSRGQDRAASGLLLQLMCLAVLPPAAGKTLLNKYLLPTHLVQMP